MDNRPNVSGGLYSELKAKLFSLKTFCLETFKLTFLNHKSINLPKISVLFGEERHLNSSHIDVFVGPDEAAAPHHILTGGVLQQNGQNKSGNR
jgi:hypothetical protein